MQGRTVELGRRRRGVDVLAVTARGAHPPARDVAHHHDVVWASWLSTIEVIHAGERSSDVGGRAQTVHMPPSAAEILDFEAAHPRHTGAKEVAIRVELGVTPARFYQLLDRAAQSRDGIAHDPFTARRVRDRAA